MLSLVGLIALIISILIVVFITQLLWNYAMVPVFGLTKQIEFWQTLALLILSGIFFGGHCNASSINSMNNMMY